MSVKTCENSGLQIRSLHDLSDYMPALAVALYRQIPTSESGAAEKVFMSDLFKREGGPVVRTMGDLKAMSRGQRVLRLLEGPVQVADVVFCMVSLPKRHMYQKTKQVMARRGTLEDQALRMNYRPSVRADAEVPAAWSAAAEPMVPGRSTETPTIEQAMEAVLRRLGLSAALPMPAYSYQGAPPSGVIHSAPAGSLPGMTGWPPSAAPSASPDIEARLAALEKAVFLPPDQVFGNVRTKIQSLEGRHVGLTMRVEDLDHYTANIVRAEDAATAADERRKQNGIEWGDASEDLGE